MLADRPGEALDALKAEIEKADGKAQLLRTNLFEEGAGETLIVRAIERNVKDYYIGFPKCLFVCINAILPPLGGWHHAQAESADSRVRERRIVTDSKWIVDVQSNGIQIPFGLSSEFLVIELFLGEVASFCRSFQPID